MKRHILWGAAVALAIFIGGTFISFVPQIFAASYTWDGGGTTNNWSDCNNWSTNVCPVAGDSVTFNSTSSKDATIDSGWGGSITAITIAADYGGTITVSRSLTMSGAFSIAGGSFNSGSQTITFNGAVTISGGTFTASSGTTTFAGNFTHTAGGTFSHNNGTVNLTGASQRTWDVSSTEEFYNFTINSTYSSTSSAVVVSSGDTLNVNNTLTLTDGGFSGNIAAKGSTISIGTNFNSSGSGGTLTVNGTGTQTVSMAVPSVSNYNIVNTITINNSSATVVGTGATGTIKFTTLNVTAGTVNFSGYSGTIATLTINGGSLIGSSSGTLSIGTTTLSSGSFNGGSATVTHSSSLNISGGTYTASTGTTSLSDNFTYTSGTFAHNSGTVSVTGSSQKTWDVHTPGSIDFYNLTINSTCAGSCLYSATTDTINVLGTLTLTDGSVAGFTLAAQGSSVTIGTNFGYSSNTSGTLLINGSGVQTVTMAVTATAGNEPFDKITLNNSQATFSGTGTTGTLVLDKITATAGTLNTSDYVLTANEAVVVDGGSVTLGTSGTNLFSSSFAMSAGTFNGGSASVDFDGAFTLSGGTFTATTGTTYFGSSYTHTAGGTFVHNSGTVEFNDVSNDAYNVTSSETFYNLSINKPSFAGTIATGTTFIVTGNLSLTDGHFDGGTLEVQGDVTVAATYDAGTSALLFSGSNNQAFSLGVAGNLDGDITIQKASGTVTQSSALTMNAAGQDLTISSGTYDLAGSNLTVNGTSGTVVVSSGATFKLQGGETLTFNASNPTLQSGSLVKYSGTSGPYTLKNYTYSSIEIAGDSAAVFALPATLSVGANLTITSGILNLAGNGLTVTGTFSNLATLRLQGSETVSLTPDTDSGTVQYVGDGDAAADAYTLKNWTYYNLNIATTDSGDIVQATSSPLAIEGNFTVDTGVFEAPAVMDLKGTFAHNGGTFTHNSGTVNLTGTNQALAGSTTFNNLAKTVTSAATLTLPANETQTIIGTITLQGASGQRLSLRSSTPTTQATIDPQGSRTVAYLDIQDNKNNNATAISCLTSCVDSGNNTNWAFATPGVTVTESDGSTAVTEDGATDTFTVVLQSLPSANVTVTLNASGVSIDSSPLTFTTVNWNTPQTVTVSVTNDSIAQGARSGSVAFTTTSVDSSYNGLSIPSINVSISDNDTAGVTITESSGSTNIIEGGATDSYSIVLTSQPTNTVTVNAAPTSQATVSTDTLTFTTLNWSTPQTVTVTAVNDQIAEGTHSTTLINTATSSDTAYNGISVASVSATITDNDTAGFTIGAISGNTTEAGGTATFTIVLDTQPTADVSIGTSSSDTTEGTVSPSLLTFTALNWSTPQTVTLTGIDDFVDDGDIAYSIVTAAASSSDTFYNNLNAADVNATNTDNDTAGFTIAESSASTAVVEQGATDSFTVVLNTQPESNVVFDVTSSDPSSIAVSAATLTFTDGNWSTPQTVTVTGVDDGNIISETATITIAVHDITSDNVFDPLADQTVSASTTDNDTAGITVSSISGNTSEGGGTATFTVVLTSQPTANVSIGMTSSNTSEGTVSPSTLTFTSGNWSTPQTVTVTGIDDSVDDGDIAYNIVIAAASSTDNDYNQLDPGDINATNTDNDTAGITVSPISGNTTEAGGTATFTVVLASQPIANVSIAVTSNTTTEGTVSPSSVVFTTLNWSTPQTVTVTGIDDSIDDGDIAYQIILAPASSADPNYNERDASDRNLSNTDDDTAGITLTESGGSTVTTEGGATDSYTLVLNSKPLNDVTITITPNAQVSTSQGTAVFTPTNWSIAQTITVTAVNDLVTEDSHSGTVTHSASSSDTLYNGFNIPTISVNITDNDTAGITISPASDNTTEAGGTATFTAVLTSQPTADVSIGISSSDTTEGTVSPSSLTFTTLNWNTPQTVTITGVNDGVDDGDISYGIINAAATSSDTFYNGLDASDVSITNIDNDTVGITVTQSAGTTAVIEGSGQDSYDIVLNSEPTSEVTVNITADAGLTASPTTLTFTTLNWSISQTITISAIDNDDADGPRTPGVHHAVGSVDNLYNNFNITDVTVHVTDNDTAAIVVGGSPSSTTEAGATTTFTLALGTQPTADVVIPILSLNVAEATVSTSSITLTPDNWNNPQTVTITGVDDLIDDGNQMYTIQIGAAASSDSNYNGLDVTDLNPTNIDDDTASVNVSVSGDGTAVTEGGVSDTYTVVLTSQPMNDVVITATHNNQLSASPTTLTFTNSDWNVPQIVTVTAVNDQVAEGAHSASVTHNATSSDITYNAISVASVSTSVTDDDTAGFTITDISEHTTEIGGTATFTIALNTQPTADVTIELTSSDATEGTISPSSITFTSSNWNTPQTVTITGVDDAVDDGDISYTITTSAAVSADGFYNTMNPSNPTAINNDNDASGVLITESNGTTQIAEGGAADALGIVLTSQPLFNVVVLIEDGSDINVSPASLIFTPSNWNTTQVVTITAIDDSSTEDTETSPLTFTTTSTDPTYEALSITNVTVTITDNDSVSNVGGESGGGGGGGSGGSGGGSGSPTTAISLALRQPVANIAYAANTQLTVSWNWTGSIPAVNVYLSWDNGTTWNLVRYAVTNTGSTTVLLDGRTGSVKLRLDGTDYLQVITSVTSGSFYIDGDSTDVADGNQTEASGEEIAKNDNRVASLPESAPVHSLVKIPDDGDENTDVDSAIYYIGADGRRHVFPSEKVFESWYCDFSEVKEISAEDLAAIPWGVNVTYRPGSRLVKFMTDPRVYAVDRDGSLRWLISEDVAIGLYGTDWAHYVDDISDAFYGDYRIGQLIDTPNAWDRNAAQNGVTNLSDIIFIPGYTPSAGTSFTCSEGTSVASFFRNLLAIAR
jgi:hypothetical protein